MNSGGQARLRSDVVGRTVHEQSRRSPWSASGPRVSGSVSICLPSGSSLNQRDYFFPDSPFLREWDAKQHAMYGRLKDGVSPAAARESCARLMAALHQQQPEHFEKDEWLEPAMGTPNFMDQGERIRILGAMSLLGVLTDAGAPRGGLEYRQPRVVAGDGTLPRAGCPHRAWREAFPHRAPTGDGNTAAGDAGCGRRPHAGDVGGRHDRRCRRHAGTSVSRRTGGRSASASRLCVVALLVMARSRHGKCRNRS